MILHIDLDCFFVSAARICDDSLNGKAIAVVSSGGDAIFGGKKEQGKIVLSASYEARKFGVCSAMPVFKAKKLCKGLILAFSDYEFYLTLSNQLQKLLYNYTPTIQKVSIDEYFIDISGTIYEKDTIKFAQKLQREILDKLKLPCSIGICASKWLSKLATDLAKPFGIKFIDINLLEDELKGIEISKFPGIGRASLEFFNKHGLYHLDQALKSEFLFARLGKNGQKLFERISGRDKSGVSDSCERKSLAMARTFEEIYDRDEILRRVRVLCRHLSFDLYKLGIKPTKFEVKIHYKFDEIYSHSATIRREFSEMMLYSVAKELFYKCDIRVLAGITYIGVGVGGFSSNLPLQQDLFNSQNDTKMTKVASSLNKIRQKYGIDAVKSGSEIEP